METGQLHQQRPGTSGDAYRNAVVPAGTACRPADDTLVVDNPNYGIVSMSDIYIENQGTFVVRVNEHMLLPGDTLRIQCPVGFRLEHTLHIRFLSAFAMTLPVAQFPQLYAGKRLFVSYIPFPKF